jgi:hypothetical protein
MKFGMEIADLIKGSELFLKRRNTTKINLYSIVKERGWIYAKTIAYFNVVGLGNAAWRGLCNRR